MGRPMDAASDLAKGLTGESQFPERFEHAHLLFTAAEFVSTSELFAKIEEMDELFSAEHLKLAKLWKEFCDSFAKGPEPFNSRKGL